MTIKNKELKTKIKVFILKSLNSDAKNTKQSIKMKFSTKKSIIQHIETGNNKKYPDVFFFYDDKDL